MPGPFDFLTPDPGTPFGNMMTTFGLGKTQSARDWERDYQIQQEEQRTYATLAAKAAELARTATDRGQLAIQLLSDPVGMDALGKLPQEKIKPLFDDILKNVKPDMATDTIGKDTMLYGMQPGASGVTPLAQGPTEHTTQNPFGDVTSKTSTPGQVFGTQPQAPQAPAAPQIPMPQGFSMMPNQAPTAQATPGQVPSAPAAMEPGTQPSTFYEATIAAEGTAARGDPYEEVLGYGKWGKTDKPLTQMTLAEVKQFGTKMRHAQAATGVPWDKTSSAAGAFQIVGNTLEDAQKALGLPDSTTFSPDVQRRMADWIAQNQGLDAWEGFKANPQARAQVEGALGLQPSTEQPSVSQSTLDTSTAGLPARVTDADIGRVAEENPSTYFLDTGVAPFLVDWVGRTGRQVNTKINTGLLVSKARARQARLRHAVLTTREGREDLSEGKTLEGLVPNFGPTSDPVSTLAQGVSLYDYASKNIQDAVNIINDPNRSKAAKEKADTTMSGWNRVLQELPKRADMEAMSQQLQEHPEAIQELLTPQKLWHDVVHGGLATAGQSIGEEFTREMGKPSVPKGLSGTLDMGSIQSASPEDVRSLVLGTSNAAKGKWPLDVQRAIIAKLKAAGSIQPQGR